MINRYEGLEKRINYSFKDYKHLDIAFTHKSYANEKMIKGIESYERYEFLGDAILEFISSDFLFKTYPELPEGKLTKLRASLVCEFTLSGISSELGLGEYCKLSNGEEHTGGRSRSSLLCDMFESLVGALYLDGGLIAADNFIKTFLLTDIEHKTLFIDSKSKLQEYAQSLDKVIQYGVVAEVGPDHNKEFEVKVTIGDEEMGTGKGHSRKAAEQQAAYNVLRELN